MRIFPTRGLTAACQCPWMPHKVISTLQLHQKSIFEMLLGLLWRSSVETAGEESDRKLWMPRAGRILRPAHATHQRQALTSCVSPLAHSLTHNMAAVLRCTAALQPPNKPRKCGGKLSSTGPKKVRFQPVGLGSGGGLPTRLFTGGLGANENEH